MRRRKRRSARWVKSFGFFALEREYYRFSLFVNEEIELNELRVASSSVYKHREIKYYKARLKIKDFAIQWVTDRLGF